MRARGVSSWQVSPCRCAHARAARCWRPVTVRCGLGAPPSVCPGVLAAGGGGRGGGQLRRSVPVAEAPQVAGPCPNPLLAARGPAHWAPVIALAFARGSPCLLRRHFCVVQCRGWGGGGRSTWRPSPILGCQGEPGDRGRQGGGNRCQRSVVSRQRVTGPALPRPPVCLAPRACAHLAAFLHVCPRPSWPDARQAYPRTPDREHRGVGC